MNQKTTQSKNTQAFNKPKPILCEKVDASKLSFTELDKVNDKASAQMLAYSRYKNPTGGEGSLLFQTPEIHLVQYGLPKIGDFYKEDAQRNFVKVCFDPEQPGCVAMEKMMNAIDAHVVANKTTILGKQFSGPKANYVYQPIVREPQDTQDLDLVEEDGDEDEAKAAKDAKADKNKKADQRPRLKYCKMKLDVSYPDGKILTQVYVRSKDATLPPEERTKQVSVSNATDLQNYLTFGSKIRCIVMLNKLWASKAKNESGIRKYGVTFKIMQMEIEPSDRMGSARDTFKQYAFVDSNDDEESVETSVPVGVEKKAEVNVSKVDDKKAPAVAAKVEKVEEDDESAGAEDADGETVEADGGDGAGDAEAEAEDDAEIEEEPVKKVEPVKKPEPKKAAEVKKVEVKPAPKAEAAPKKPSRAKANAK